MRKQFENKKFFSDWLKNNYKNYFGKLTKDKIQIVESFLKSNIMFN